MRWRPNPTLVLVMIGAALTAACSPAPPDPQTRYEAAQSFSQFRQNYLLDYWSHHPIEATQAGQIQYANRLPALSADDVADQVRQLQAHLDWLDNTPDSVMNNAKLQAARNQIRAHATERLLLLKVARRWQTDPRLYLAEPAFLQLGDAELGSSDQRAIWLLARLEQLPVLLDTGLNNLAEPPQRFTVDAIRSGPRITEGLRALVDTLSAESPDLAPALQRALQNTREHLQSFVVTLRTEILPGSRDSAGVGPMVYERFLREVHGLDLTAAQWEDQAERAWQTAQAQESVGPEERRYRALVWLDARIHTGEISADAARHFLIDELDMSHPDTAQEVDNLLQYPARILSRPPDASIDHHQPGSLDS